MKKPPMAPQDTAEDPERTAALLTADGTAPRKRKPPHSRLVEPAMPGIMTRDAPGQRPTPSVEERRQPQAGGRGTRALSISPSSYNAEDHTVEAVLSSGSAVQRYYFIEELEISADAIDLGRVTSGVAPLLDTHNQFELAAQLGRILSVRIENAQLIGILQFDQTAEGQEIEARVARGDRAAIAARINAAREFRGLTLMEQARDYCQRSGMSVRGMGRLELAGAALGMRYGAMTTSDFANALSTAANKRLRAAFTAAPQTFRPLVTSDTLPDFKPASIVGLGDAPALLLVPENGEFLRGAISDTGLFYKLATYGRIIAITRQAIVNDDQSLFNRIPTMFGRKAADLESDLVWGLLLSNPTMGDGIPLFNAAHGNLAATGGAINVANVAAGEQAMLTQTSNEGGYLTIRPEYLIVGPQKKVEAQQFLTAVSAQQTSNVNPYPGNLQLIVEPRITGNQWFLAASPDAFDLMVLAHLLGQEELFTDTRVGFDVDGVENKARLDVGAAMLDYRGFYKSPTY